MTDLLNVNDLSIGFAGPEQPTVSGVNFEIQPGERLGLVGPSGSGKSLTCRALLGLLPPGAEILSGTLAYRRRNGNTVDLGQLSDAELTRLRGHEIAYVPQDCQSAFNPVLSCGRQLREAVVALHPDKKGVDARVHQLLERVELGGQRDRMMASLPYELSGGQLQRILIAMAIAGRPSLLIADEPTTALDALTEAEILRLLDGLREELRMGLLLITHDRELLRRVTDRVVSLPGSLPDETPLPASRPGVDSLKTTEPPILVTQSLTIGYEGSEVPAVRDCDLTIGAGEYVGLVGPSGCGKSTLAKFLAGMVSAQSGRVTFGGAEVDLRLRWGKSSPLKRTQLVFQDLLGSLNPAMRVGAAVREVSRLYDREEPGQLFARVGLDYASLGQRYPRELSGGQRQRIVLLRALVAKPRLLICDEAVSALDVHLRKEMQDLLRRCSREDGISILFISHDLRDVARHTDRILIMDEGQIVESLTPRQLLGGPRSSIGQRLAAAAGLDIP